MEHYNFILIQSDNKILLYTHEGKLLWDFGTFENINNMTLLLDLCVPNVYEYFVPNATEEELNNAWTSTYVFENNNKKIVLKYNARNKTGTVE